jgi:ADP-ribose pyrophosphatase YjhB (NUDIX family)
MQTHIRVRGLIWHNDKLMMVKHKAKDFYCLAGGHVENNEDLRTAMARELEEELGVKAIVGKLSCVQELFYEGGHSLEFFFQIENGADFMTINKHASHAYELENAVWIDPEDENVTILPTFLRTQGRPEQAFYHHYEAQKRN